ncbi:high-potential iron-sulfur protein [Viridibacterium curvum]
MLNRRRFISLVPVAGLGLLACRGASAAPVPESDPAAAALGYKADATKVDAKSFPSWKAGNVCAGCGLYSGKAGAASGPCAAFGGREVAAKGWCAAWAKKA